VVGGRYYCMGSFSFSVDVGNQADRQPDRRQLRRRSEFTVPLIFPELITLLFTFHT
jgi:hypothetical protein